MDFNKTYVVATVPETTWQDIYSGQSEKPVSTLEHAYFTWLETEKGTWLVNISNNVKYNSAPAKLGVVNWETQYYPLYDHFVVSMVVAYDNIVKKIVSEVQIKSLSLSPKAMVIPVFNKMAKELIDFVPLLSHEEAFQLIKQSFPFNTNWQEWSVKQQSGLLNHENKIPHYNVEDDADKLPGVFTLVHSPCDCLNFEKVEVKTIIIHLNDEHTDWDRNTIADWLDKLHDEGIINIEFSPWEEPEENQLKEEN